MKKQLLIAIIAFSFNAFAQCPSYPGQTMLSPNTYSMQYSQSVGTTQFPTPFPSGTLASNWSVYDNLGNPVTTTVSCGGLYGNNTAAVTIIPNQSIANDYTVLYNDPIGTLNCVWYVRINPVVGICGTVATGINEIDVTSIKIFPNPISETLNITNETSLINRITVVSTTGELMILQNTKASNCSVDISKLANGLYFVKIETTQGNITKKIIKN